jgi:hypothetical protein
MRLAVFALLVASFVPSMASADSRPADATVEAAMKRPRIAAALAARTRMDKAAIDRDMDQIRALLAPDIVLNGPNNKINDSAAILANIAAGRVNHGTMDRTIEHVAERGSDVIMMGEEVTTYEDKSIRRRRFTDIWTETAEGWKIVLRQATVYGSSGSTTN